ncbi:hypothetical protein THAOC_08335, partial [Thalassiosira oceanica]
AAKAAGDAMLPPVVDRDSATAGSKSRIKRGRAVVDGGWGKLAIFLNDGWKERVTLPWVSSNGTDFTGPNPIATWSFSNGIWRDGKKGQSSSSTGLLPPIPPVPGRAADLQACRARGYQLALMTHAGPEVTARRPAPPKQAGALVYPCIVDCRVLPGHPHPPTVVTAPSLTGE